MYQARFITTNQYQFYNNESGLIPHGKLRNFSGKRRNTVNENYTDNIWIRGYVNKNPSESSLADRSETSSNVSLGPKSNTDIQAIESFPERSISPRSFSSADGLIRRKECANSRRNSGSVLQNKAYHRHNYRNNNNFSHSNTLRSQVDLKKPHDALSEFLLLQWNQFQAKQLNELDHTLCAS